jgi:hypothetical protein
VTALLWMFIPWATGFALQRAAGTRDLQAAPITVSYAPEIGRFQRPEASVPPTMESVNLFLPLRIDGITAGELVVVDQARIRIRSAAGETLFQNSSRAFGRGYGQLYPWKPTEAMTASHRLLTFQQLPLPAWLFARLKDVSTAVEIDYSLTVLRAQPAQRLAALGGDDTTDGRRCFSRPNGSGDGLGVSCLSVKKNPSCASVYLQPDSTVLNEGCAPDYAPYRLTLSSRLVNRLMVTVPFHGNAHLLKQSDVVIVPYEATLHVSRHLTIPSVQLSTWQGET